MRLLLPAKLNARVERLRAAGVSFPKTYPPRNLPLGTEWFQAVLGQIETVELACETQPADRIVVEPRGMIGDVDILIDVSPKYRLQVMEWVWGNVRTEKGTFAASDVLARTRSDVLRRFQGGRKVAPAVHQVRIHEDLNYGVAYSGMSRQIRAMDSTQLTVFEFASELTNAISEAKLDRCLSKAHRQLSAYEDAILVPVCNLSRYPHNQAHLLRYTQLVLKRDHRWSKLGGVLFVTMDHAVEEPTTGLYLGKVRFIGAENPNAPPSKRLNPYAFNRRMDDETVYGESTVVLSTHPLGVPHLIRRGEIWINDSRYGSLPRPLGQPFAVRLPRGIPRRHRFAK